MGTVSVTLSIGLQVIFCCGYQQVISGDGSLQGVSLLQINSDLSGIKLVPS